MNSVLNVSKCISNPTTNQKYVLLSTLSPGEFTRLVTPEESRKECQAMLKDMVVKTNELINVTTDSELIADYTDKLNSLTNDLKELSIKPSKKSFKKEMKEKYKELWHATNATFNIAYNQSVNGIKIYGTYETYEDAQEHLRIIKEDEPDNSFNIFCGKLNEFLPYDPSFIDSRTLKIYDDKSVMKLINDASKTPIPQETEYMGSINTSQQSLQKFTIITLYENNTPLIKLSEETVRPIIAVTVTGGYTSRKEAQKVLYTMRGHKTSMTFIGKMGMWIPFDIVFKKNADDNGKQRCLDLELFMKIYIKHYESISTFDRNVHDVLKNKTPIKEELEYIKSSKPKPKVEFKEKPLTDDDKKAIEEGMIELNSVLVELLK